MDDTTEIAQQTVDSAELADLIQAVIERGHVICFTAPGGSMLPFIRSGDKIFVSPVEKRMIRKGDVLVFYRNPDRRVLAHRVVEIEGDRFFCKGDNVDAQSDGWIVFENVLGRVVRVERDGESVRFGVGLGKYLVAWLSRTNRLVPFINVLRKIKWGMKGLFSRNSRS